MQILLHLMGETGDLGPAGMRRGVTSEIIAHATCRAYLGLIKEVAMSRSSILLALAVLGAVLPYVFFLRFFELHGVGGNFVGALFANGAAGGFTADLLVSSVVFWIFLFAEAPRVGVRHPWVYVALNLSIGLSCALPAFLWARERASRPATAAMA